MIHISLLLCAYMTVLFSGCCFNRIPFDCLACVLPLSSTYAWYVALLTTAHPNPCSNACCTVVAWSHRTVHSHMLHSQVLLPVITQQCPGLSAGAVCLTVLALVSLAGGFSISTLRRLMHRPDQITLQWQPVTSFCPGVNFCLCLQHASTCQRSASPF